MVYNNVALGHGAYSVPPTTHAQGLHSPVCLWVRLIGLTEIHVGFLCKHISILGHASHTPVFLVYTA